MKKEKKDIATLFVKKMMRIFHIKASKKTEKLFIQIFKFIIVGGIATIIDFIGIYIFKEFLHFPILLANTLSFCIANRYNYMASTKWVFDVNKDKDPKKNFVIFLVFSVIGLVLNDLIMWFTVDKFDIYYLLGKVIATCFVMIFNFITRKIFLE